MDRYLDVLIRENYDSLETFLEANKPFIPNTDRELYVYLVVVLEAKDMYTLVVEFFDSKLNTVTEEELLKTQELPEDYQELIDDQYEIERLRKTAWKLAIQGMHKDAIELLIIKENSNLTITTDDMYKLYQISMRMISNAMNNGVLLERENNKTTRLKISNSPITYVDIIGCLCENEASSQQISKIISKINDESTIIEILSCLIRMRKDSLVSNLMNDKDINFDYKFIQVAIENDSFKTLFYLQDKFPQGYSDNEKFYVNSIMNSLNSSNKYWLIKISLFKSIVDSLNYRKTETFL